MIIWSITLVFQCDLFKCWTRCNHHQINFRWHLLLYSEWFSRGHFMFYWILHTTSSSQNQYLFLLFFCKLFFFITISLMLHVLCFVWMFYLIILLFLEDRIHTSTYHEANLIKFLVVDLVCMLPLCAHRSNIKIHLFFMIVCSFIGDSFFFSL